MGEGGGSDFRPFRVDVINVCSLKAIYSQVCKQTYFEDFAAGDDLDNKDEYEKLHFYFYF